MKDILKLAGIIGVLYVSENIIWSIAFNKVKKQETER